MSKLYLDIISDIVECGQVEGAIRRDLYLGLVKRLIIGSVDEVINTWLHAGGQYDLVSMADPLVELFIRGIGVQPHVANSADGTDESINSGWPQPLPVKEVE
jgi:TetR/AcrR family fatty acid metabolism transcriptional regulator